MISTPLAVSVRLLMLGYDAVSVSPDVCALVAQSLGYELDKKDSAYVCTYFRNLDLERRKKNYAE